MTNIATNMQAYVDEMLGQHVLIRSADSGVHLGVLKAVHIDSKITVVLENSRRLWEWATANDGISLSEIAIAGIDQSRSKVTAVLPTIMVADVCEIIPAHGMAVPTIMGAEEHRAT